MKRRTSLLLLLALCLQLCACAPAAPSAQGTTFTDDLGRTVCVSGTGRVAALLGSYADMWLLAGGTVCAAAHDAWEDFGLALPADTIDLGSTHRPDREGLLASRPELVLASAKLARHLELRDTLEAAGIPVAYFDVGDFDDYLRVLRLMTGLTGNAQAFEDYGTALDTRIRQILARRAEEPAQTVLVLRASASDIRAKNSDGTMLGGMLRDFGCVNIADSDHMLLDDLNIESIAAADPDRIFLVGTGTDPEAILGAVDDMFRDNPLWYTLAAVREGRVHYMDNRLFNLKPNARFAEAYEVLETILYED